MSNENRIKELETVIDDLKEQITDLELDNSLLKTDIEVSEHKCEMYRDLIVDLVKSLWFQNFFDN